MVVEELEEPDDGSSRRSAGPDAATVADDVVLAVFESRTRQHLLVSTKPFQVGPRDLRNVNWIDLGRCEAPIAWRAAACAIAARSGVAGLVAATAGFVAVVADRRAVAGGEARRRCAFPRRGAEAGGGDFFVRPSQWPRTWTEESRAEPRRLDDPPEPW